MKNSIFTFTTRTVVTISIGAALYGVTGLIGVPIGPNTQLRPSIIILSIFSVYFGPIVGFLAGWIGHMLTDMLAGWGLWWNWELTSGVFGFCVGIVYLFKGFNVKYGMFKTKHIVFLGIIGVVGFTVAYSLAGLSDIVLMGEPPRKIFYQVIIITVTNSFVFLFFAIPIILSFLVTNRKNRNLVIEE
ncbi:MAG: ECF-type riboflavin transporter substrate-binding protein [bacterium]|nr:ECF-type riboflavin transporter substrate-binding protein [bacterium]